MVEHLIMVFMSFVISVVPLINFLQLHQIIKILNDVEKNDIVEK